MSNRCSGHHLWFFGESNFHSLIASRHASQNVFWILRPLKLPAMQPPATVNFAFGKSDL